MTDQVLFAQNQARLNVTWGGANGDLPDALAYDLTDTDVRRIATEAVQAGSIPGIPAAPDADFTDFVVDRFPSTDETENRLFVRPKVPFGK